MNDFTPVFMILWGVLIGVAIILATWYVTLTTLFG